ncbi:MAG: class I SAM-dependent methyltransferase [Myxococcota bacterium]
MSSTLAPPTAARAPAPPSESAAPSPLFAAVWDQVIGPKSEPFRPMLEGLALDACRAVAAELRDGERVLDVGCSWGRTTRLFAEVVGPSGHVVGIDCVRSYIAAAERETLANTSYLVGDAGAFAYAPASFDVVASVEGVMFFSQAARAFAHLGRALRPGGRLVLAVPRSESENVWMAFPKQVARDHLGLPPAGPTCGPGPFSLGRSDDLVRTLLEAGFVDVVTRPLDEPFVFGTLEETLELHLRLGAVGELVRLHGLDEARQATLRRHLADALAPYATPAGVSMPGALWLVTATRG